MLSPRACLPLRARHLGGRDALCALRLPLSSCLRSVAHRRGVEAGHGRGFPRLRPWPMPHLSVNASYHPRGHGSQTFPRLTGIATTRSRFVQHPSDLRSRPLHGSQLTHGGIGGVRQPVAEVRHSVGEIREIANV